LTEVGNGKVALAIAGRVLDQDAKSVRFSSPSGDSIEKRIGAGFFVAGVQVDFCPEEDWTPTFIALSGEAEVARANILLVKVHHGPGGCGFPIGPHGPYDSQRGRLAWARRSTLVSRGTWLA
jgi:hypothetical protein